jgi:hypothetical protein
VAASKASMAELVVLDSFFIVSIWPCVAPARWIASERENAPGRRARSRPMATKMPANIRIVKSIKPMNAAERQELEKLIINEESGTMQFEYDFRNRLIQSQKIQHLFLQRTEADAFEIRIGAQRQHDVIVGKCRPDTLPFILAPNAFEQNCVQVDDIHLSVAPALICWFGNSV